MLNAEERQQLATAADELEAFQLELHGGPHDKHRVTMCLAVAAMRMVAGVDTNPLAHLRKHVAGVKTPDPFIEHFAKEEAAKSHSYDAGGVNSDGGKSNGT